MNNNKSDVKVNLITHTPNPEEIIASSAKLCYSAVGIEEIQEGLTQDKTDNFIKMLMNIGHESPLEHCSFTFAVEGVSKSLTHQLVRHRIASYSQQSQRYVRLNQFQYIIPPEVEKNTVAKNTYIKSMEDSQRAYDNIFLALMLSKIGYSNNFIESLCETKREEIVEDFKVNDRDTYLKFEKKSIEDARYVFPNACETKIVVTMNARSLINFFKHRCCFRSQHEIRQMAMLMLKECKKVTPTIFKNVGSPCVMTGVCKEGNMQCDQMKTIIPTK